MALLVRSVVSERHRTCGVPERRLPILRTWARVLALLAVCGLLLGGGTGFSAGVIDRGSVASDGTEGNAESLNPCLSEDGRYLAFNSHASNLVSGDTNGVGDVFVRDCQTGLIIRVSVASDGTQANAGSAESALSGDGRYVVFVSAATNLVSGDMNGVADVFVHDCQTGETTRVSVASDGTEANVASGYPCITPDGRYVAFSSAASNLTSGDSNGARDSFVHDCQTGETTRVRAASDGAPEGSGSWHVSLSADGRYLAFESAASDLVAGDTNGASDVLVYDRQTAETTRVSVASDGAEGNLGSYWPSLSATGRYIAFGSVASNLVSDDTDGQPDIFVHDRETGQTTRVSMASDGTEGNLPSFPDQAISANGQYVAFRSSASNLVSGDINGYSDVFVHDCRTGQTTRVSTASDGTEGNHISWEPAISADGRCVAFSSGASNLVSGDTNGYWDVFVSGWQAVPEVEIDIKPGSARNPVNPKSEGVLPVAVFSSEVFDATQIDPSTVVLAGAVVARNPDDGSWMMHIGDENEDGVMDVRLFFDTEGIQVELLEDGYAVMTGSVLGGLEFTGRDIVTIVPKDIPNDSWAIESIAECLVGGVVGGYSDGTYRPDLPVTRDQMAVFISRALAGGDAHVPTGPPVATFSDVPTDHWAFKYVEYTVDSGVVAGYGDGTYRPTPTVTRDQMAVFMARAMAGGESSVPTGPSAASFPDVPTDYWAFRYVEYIKSGGVTGGYPDGNYHPEYACTRDQMAVYVARGWELPM